MDEYLNELKKCPLFAGIKESDYKVLLSCINAYTKDFKNNEYLFFSGDKVNYVGIILAGSLELHKENLAGTKHILDFLGPSNMFAEGIVCTADRISPVTVKTKEQSKVLFIPFERIVKTCGNSCEFHAQLIRNMMLVLSEKNYNLNQKIELLMLKGMREKLATYLLSESRKHNSLTFQIVPNRNELAEFLNVSRTSMCRELAKMRDEGLLDYYQNSFKILALEKLKSCLAI